MNDLRKTLAFAAVAAVLAVGAVFAVPRHTAPSALGDEGEVFYPEFTDTQKAAALEIVEFDEPTATARPFKVEFKNGRWVIPSHYNYPADAQDRLAKVAARLVGLRKDVFRTNRTQDHEACGVVDPLDDKAGTLKGIGRRVTLRDAEGKVLADFIFGKRTETAAPSGFGQKPEDPMYYVRMPTHKQVYACRTNAEISSSFGDWIETDLLKLTASTLRKITFDLYTVNESQGRINDDRTQFQLSRDGDSAPWTLGDLKETEEVNTEVVGAMESALDDLRIAGVRPKPPGLTRALRQEGDGRISAQDSLSLRARGYYLTNAGIVSNEGQISATCDDGVVYTLRFGEVLFGSGEELTKGTEPKEATDPKDPRTPVDPDKAAATENRYLFVTADFDESSLGSPPAAPAPLTPDPAWTEEQKKKEEDKHKQATEDHDRRKKDFDEKLAAGRKRAQQLSNRFAEWYYVIGAENYRKLRKQRSEVVKPKTAKPEPPKEEPKDDHKDHKHD